MKRSLDPATDHELRERELDRKSYTLSISELLDGFPLDIEGVDMEARVDVVLINRGGNEIEIDSISIGDIYLIVPWSDALILIDQDSFKTRHKRMYQLFITKVEARAIQCGREMPLYKWEEVEND
jgi:hypothetical protein